ncbi:MAG: hypothetical protein PF489_02805 [Salinivirgaceae bacterium]|jgi:hypothetical protein|nr:hypothetical protein [Salinivirgaceae bacterium]
MRYLFLLLIAGYALVGHTQTHDYSKSRCFDFHKQNCDKSTNKYYQYNSESRSGLFHKGQRSRTVIEAYNGRDYRISICHDDVFNKPVVFRIIDKMGGEVLYDNSQDNYAKDFEFTVTTSIELFIEIEVQGESPLVEKRSKMLIRRDNEVGCVGVLIEYMVTPRKGF